ncbi:Altered inheritance of mitochondria protein 9, mitochondrial [Sphaceloma murrayae]|uniref:Altered inheritance of mitochondria protein 9, mitochondrial n=1 Tax=Sphaceloma murrayae TaxID=2082308 RepID=A0A2K1QN33_9PEZI|nr:Altered inheritance of mitochondria protein 9, mitochondrial [Sphaceloma murrayae]
MRTSSDTPLEDGFWDEQSRLSARYRRFDVSALKNVAASSVRRQRCVAIDKIAEGGFNKVFRLTMEDHTAEIARIPNQKAESSSMSIASEVATMDFASSILGLPVPKVLSYGAHADNPVQSEYIIMEEASGTQLGKMWPTMDINEKTGIVRHLASMIHKLSSVYFACYGNIYFAADRVPGSRPAVVQGGLSPETKAEIRQRYAIGPVVESSFWEEDELAEHAAESEGYDDNANFWASISDLAGRGGFVLQEDYDHALEMFRKLREEGLRSLEGVEREQLEQATTWAIRNEDVGGPGT